jgi:ketosteroid isomerase-like protein
VDCFLGADKHEPSPADALDSPPRSVRPPRKSPSPSEHYRAPVSWFKMGAEVDVVRAYWAAAERRDWDAFGAVVSEDVVYEAPQSRERVRGRDAYVRFNREGFPGDWHLEVVTIVGGDHTAASWLNFTDADGTQPGLCFFVISDDNAITRITDFWPEPYEPPASRAHLVERY